MLSLYFTINVLRTATKLVEKREYGLRPQGNVQMLRVGFKWLGKCCLSIITLGHGYPLSRLSVYKIPAENCQWKNPFLPKKYKKTEQHFYGRTQNRHEHYWNWQMQKKLNNTSTTKKKPNKYTCRLRYIMKTWRTSIKLKNTKKLIYKVSKNGHSVCGF